MNNYNLILQNSIDHSKIRFIELYFIFEWLVINCLIHLRPEILFKIKNYS